MPRRSWYKFTVDYINSNQSYAISLKIQAWNPSSSFIIARISLSPLSIKKTRISNLYLFFKITNTVSLWHQALIRRTSRQRPPYTNSFPPMGITNTYKSPNHHLTKPAHPHHHHTSQHLILQSQHHPHWTRQPLKRIIDASVGNITRIVLTGTRRHFVYWNVPRRYL